MKFLIQNLTLNDGITITLNLPEEQIGLLDSGSTQHFLYQHLKNHEYKEYHKWKHNHEYQTEIFDF